MTQEKPAPADLVEAWNAYKVNLAALPQMLKAAEVGFAAGYDAAHRRAAATTPQPDPRDAVIAELREALGWYADQAEGCRKITGEGDIARLALDRDGGKRARSSLAKEGK